ncbi:MAG: agmatine deiminase family protein [Bacteroidota bacterium]
MRYIITFLFLTCTLAAWPQHNLPHHITAEEKARMPEYLSQIDSKGYTQPPQSPLRTPGEWEEIDYLTITWRSYKEILSQIVEHAQKQATVIIHCADSNSVKSDLAYYGVTPTNVLYVEAPTNSIWIRDYGAQTVYYNDVDSLLLVDWIYNRPRPDDDALPEYTSAALGMPLYQTTQSPWALVNTGGNFMADGFGTAFSSNLILDENPSLTTSEVDSLMYHFMGIDTFIHMTNLPYDNIHHIDMHMKLLDEQTLLVGEYPQGVADGPQIEANLQYVISQFNATSGTPFKVIRIPMPPSPSGLYPDQGGYYRTYTNGVFVNNTYLVPTYYEKYDTTALRILREAMPGYDVVGINSSDIIPASGAIHCITNSVGSDDPLLISHQPFEDTVQTISQYLVEATIKHRSGIASATVYYTTDTAAGFQALPMTSNIAGQWIAPIPAPSSVAKIYYYIQAGSNSGKTMTRPMPAPKGCWSFVADKQTGIIETAQPMAVMDPVYPNPASAITAIPVHFNTNACIKLSLLDISGRKVQDIFSGQLSSGQQHFFFNAANLSPGVYLVRLVSQGQVQVEKVVVE